MDLTIHVVAVVVVQARKLIFVLFYSNSLSIIRHIRTIFYQILISIDSHINKGEKADPGSLDPDGS